MTALLIHVRMVEGALMELMFSLVSVRLALREKDVKEVALHLHKYTLSF